MGDMVEGGMPLGSVVPELILILGAAIGIPGLS